METVYLLPLTIAFLAAAVAALGFRATRRRGYGPFAVGLAAAVLFLAGKFMMDMNVLVYGGLAALVGASLWNSWPVRSSKSVPVAPTETLYQIGSIEKEK